MSKDNKDRYINLGILIITGIMALGGFAAWCDARYAKESEMSQMQSEIHQIYGKLIGLKE